MIHIADITDDRLRELVDAHRDKAGQAERTVTPRKGLSLHEAAEHYRAAQNLLADVYQELLDHRHASVEPVSTHREAVEDGTKC